MTKLNFLFLSTLFLFLVGCEKFPWDKEENAISIQITDLDGKPVKETSAGEQLRFTSEEFKKYNKEGILKDSKILFDNKEAKIVAIQGDFIILEVPQLQYYDIRYSNISIRFREQLYRVLERLLYRPTVTAIVFSGIDRGVSDGTFQMPAEMAMDASGNLYVIDQRSDHDVIIKVTSSGSTSTFSNNPGLGRLVGIGVDQPRNRLYIADATSQQVKYLNLTTPGLPYVLAGSGAAGNNNGTGTGASFRFGAQRVDDFGANERGQGLVVDGTGNVIVAEYYGTGGNSSQLRKITPGGFVSNVAGSRRETLENPDEIRMPAGVTINSANEIYYVGGASSFWQGVNKITPSGSFSDVAGQVSNEDLNDGTGPAAEFAYPKAIATNNAYFYIADGTNGALRRMSPTGDVITLAGVGHFETPSFCFCGHETPTNGSYVMPGLFNSDPNRYEDAAKAIVMDQVGGVALQSGNLIYISDYGYKCIWKITIM